MKEGTIEWERSKRASAEHDAVMYYEKAKRTEHDLTEALKALREWVDYYEPLIVSRQATVEEYDMHNRSRAILLKHKEGERG